ncbi:FMN-binding protein [Patulibacter sp. S7RM1-6]
MSIAPSRWIATSLAVAATGGVLAGCGGSDDDSTASAGAADAAATTTATESSGTTTASGSASSGSYRDGTYSADGSYTSPAGQETVGVQLTVQDGKVTAVEVTPQASNPNSQKFQGEFADGISGEVVGKSLDDLRVSKVSGSSLTSGGFNAAVERVKSEAAA